MQQRTQIYLEPDQHAALIKESRRLGLSLAGLIRRLVEEHVMGKGRRAASAGERRAAALSIIGLGRSGETDVSERTAEHVAAAIEADLVKERRPAYRARSRR